jgi:hypothetical protein
MKPKRRPFGLTELRAQVAVLRWFVLALVDQVPDRPAILAKAAGLIGSLDAIHGDIPDRERALLARYLREQLRQLNLRSQEQAAAERVRSRHTIPEALKH